MMRSLNYRGSYTAAEIFWWMADLWFGLDASGFMLACMSLCRLLRAQ